MSGGSAGGWGALTEERLREFLGEDIGFGDITSNALLDAGLRARARLYFKEEGVAAGLEEAAAIFAYLGCTVRLLVEDGERAPQGRTLMEIDGPARSLLAGERTVLNIVGRMAGIATAVAGAVSTAAEVNPQVRVAATRKTAPGLRDLDKRAVELGGGDTHRFRLDDCVIIKDNHLNFGLTIGEAVERARRLVSFTKKVEVEVRTPEDAVEAVEAGADIVMFDNMAPDGIRGCLSALGERGIREGPLYEASGGISPENLGEYAGTGVDIVSMGCLTHSVRNLNVKLEIEPA
ncbi:MAG: carboxylating nicotinate-nucleotide diphosphorylase [Candidatus Bathyarchaeota archaeon]|nr:carboxylating nicotinate-nucleotide diphosphorylase [Candidatus Bathyarchaeota archaeon]